MPSPRASRSCGKHSPRAERYDRNVEAVFELQDEITMAIAARIAPEVGTAERQRTERKSPEAFGRGTSSILG